MATKRLSSQDFEDLYLGRTPGEVGDARSSLVDAVRDRVSDITPYSPNVLTAELRNLYDEAFEEAFEGDPEGMLGRLKEFRHQHVVWLAVSSNKDEFIAVETGKQVEACMSILPPNPLDHEKFDFLGVRPSGSGPILTIKPHKVSKRAAALIQVDGLCSLMMIKDRSGGVGADVRMKPEDYCDITQTMLALIERMVGDGFFALLRETLDHYGLFSFDDLKSPSFFQNISVITKPLYDMILGNESPQSPHEVNYWESICGTFILNFINFNEYGFDQDRNRQAFVRRMAILRKLYSSPSLGKERTRKKH